MAYFLYILQSEHSGVFYTGSSDNPQRRVHFHNTIETGFTSRYRPWKIVFTKEYPTKHLAQQAERKVKSWKSRKMIEQLINGTIEIYPDRVGM